MTTATNESSLPEWEGVESREGSSDSTSDSVVIRPFSGSGRGVQPSPVSTKNTKEGLIRLGEACLRPALSGNQQV